MRSLRSNFFRLCFFTDLQGVRFTLGLAEIIWALTLAWPGDTFGRPTYTAMSHVMSEEAWALVFALSGVTQFTLLLQGRFHSRFAQFFAGWNSILWWYICISMYISVFPPPAAISGELALAFGASWIFIRTGYTVTGKRATDATE